MKLLISVLLLSVFVGCAHAKAPEIQPPLGSQPAEAKDPCDPPYPVEMLKGMGVVTITGIGLRRDDKQIVPGGLALFHDAKKLIVITLASEPDGLKAVTLIIHSAVPSGGYQHESYINTGLMGIVDEKILVRANPGPCAWEPLVTHEDNETQTKQ